MAPAPDDCIFCQIVAGEIPAKTVYEDDNVLAFLDIQPLAQGHTLVIPKAHAARLAELDTEAASAYFAPVPSIAAALQKAVGADGATLAWNDGKAAGQEVGHVHLHIVPRFDGDAHGPIHALFGGGTKAGDLDALVARVRSALG